MVDIYWNEIANTALVLAPVVIFVGFIITSVVLFIRDGIKAKKEKRSRKIPITVMFIISMVLAAIAIGITVKIPIIKAAST